MPLSNQRSGISNQQSVREIVFVTSNPAYNLQIMTPNLQIMTLTKKNLHFL